MAKTPCAKRAGSSSTCLELGRRLSTLPGPPQRTHARPSQARRARQGWIATRQRAGGHRASSCRRPLPLPFERACRAPRSRLARRPKHRSVDRRPTPQMHRAASRPTRHPTFHRSWPPSRPLPPGGWKRGPRRRQLRDGQPPLLRRLANHPQAVVAVPGHRMEKPANSSSAARRASSTPSATVASFAACAAASAEVVGWSACEAMPRPALRGSRLARR